MTTESSRPTEAAAGMKEEQVKSLSEETTQRSKEGAHAAQASKAHAKVRSRRWLRIVLVVLGVILALCLIAVAALGAFVNSGKDELLADNETGSARQTIAQDGKSYILNENIVSVALIGTDRLYGYVIDEKSRGHADAIMLVAYDTSNGKVTLVNVPRNTITEFRYITAHGQNASATTFLSAAYAYGDTDAKSAETVCGAVSDLMNGIPVANYVVLLESCIGPLTEAMGGVTLTAVENIGRGIEPGKTYTLSGDDALFYVQYRNVSRLDSPALRMKRQHDFAQAFLHQSIDAIKKDPSVIGKFYDIITDPDYMTTNLHVNEMAYLLSAVVTNGVNDLEMVTLPYTEDYDPESTLMGYIPDRKGITDLVLKVFYEPAEE